MSSSRLDRPIPIVVPGPAFSPIEGGDKKKRRRHSPVSTDPNDDWKDCMLANIALEYHNTENGTSYELAGAFLLNTEFILDGAWAHCNFAAMQPSQDMNAKPPRTLFFAEMHRDDDTTCHWTVMACIVLEGNTTVGCSSCSEVIHPTHGFTQGHRKPKFSVQPTTCSLASYNKHELSKNKALEPSALRRMHAEDALELYNSKNGANYKLVDAFLSKDLLSDGSWFHCNFTAKQPNEDIAPKHFFAEIYSGDAYAPISCFILEGQTTDRCSWCSGVLHPTHGFRSRVCKYSVATYLPLWFRPIKHRPTSSLQQTTYSTASYSLYAFLQDPERRKAYYDEMSKRTLADYVRPKAMEPSILHRKHAEDALEQYNRKNGANYEVVDTLVSEDLLSDTTWYHINFTAKPPNEDMDPKHFFAEIYCGDAYSPGDCLMLEEGETTKDCTFCSEVIHPTRGFTSKVRKYGPGAVKGPEYKPNLPSAVN